MGTKINVKEIISALNELKIDYSLYNIDGSEDLKFCSLKKIEKNGFYYFEGDAGLAGNFSGSIFLAKVQLDKQKIGTIVVDQPQVVFYKLMRYFFHDPEGIETGMHETVVIDKAARIHESAYIGPFCVIGKAIIGPGARLHSHVAVFDKSEIGKGVIIEPHSTIGATGVAWVWDPETGQLVVQPQIGGVKIGDGCFLGSDVSIVRGSVNEITTIGQNCMIAHGSKIAHGCIIGNKVHLANNVSLAGTVTIGDRSFLGAASVICSGISLAPDTIVAAGAVVVENVDIPHQILMGVPAKGRPANKKKMRGIPALLNDGVTNNNNF